VLGTVAAYLRLGWQRGPDYGIEGGTLESFRSAALLILIPNYNKATRRGRKNADCGEKFLFVSLIQAQVLSHLSVLLEHLDLKQSKKGCPH
jgi:hypothetical protein